MKILCRCGFPLQKVTSQAGPPRVQVQSLEMQSKGLSAEPPFMQTNMEQDSRGHTSPPSHQPDSCVNSHPALSHTQSSAFPGGTPAVLTAGISKDGPSIDLVTIVPPYPGENVPRPWWISEASDST
uniref:Uncharacterized protein n=1 Tax=Piliocolobus tephrosceles TaxID=591936 RepID=A0A8C9ISA3_9PRIM